MILFLHFLLSFDLHQEDQRQCLGSTKTGSDRTGPDHGPDHGSDCGSDQRLDQGKKFKIQNSRSKIQNSKFKIPNSKFC